MKSLTCQRFIGFRTLGQEDSTKVMIVHHDGTDRSDKEVITELADHLAKVYQSIQENPYLTVQVSFTYGCIDHGHENEFRVFCMDRNDLGLARYKAETEEEVPFVAGLVLAGMVVKVLRDAIDERQLQNLVLSAILRMFSV